MSKINRHPVRRTAAGVLAGALALSGAVATALPANAAPGFALERLAGEGRYETSAATARAFIAANGAAVTNVILASGEAGRTADALAASFLAGVQNAPVVLTQQTTIPGATREVLATLRAQGATTLTVVGGPVAVSDAQLTELRGLGFTVERVGGADRYATAAAVVAKGEGASASNVGLLASGVSTIDALAGGPVAFKGKHPLFLTTRDDIPGSIVASMRAAGVTSVFILGGEAVVGPRVRAELAANNITIAGTLAGANRSETSVAIANAVIGGTFGFSATTFNVASGLNEGVDALGGAALSGKQNRVLLVTNNATSAAPITAFATANAAKLTTAGTIFGGPAVVATTLETAVETAAGATGNNFQTLNVTPTETATLQLADENPANTAAVRNADNRTYTVTGLNNALRYRITLVNAASIQGTGTARTFLSSPLAGSTTAFGVDIGADLANIVSVNGGAPTGLALDDRTATATPVNGSITFEIDGQAPGTVVPAVYIDGGQGGTSTTGGADNRLETSAAATGGFAAVTETFGLGGPTTFINPAAASGNVGALATPPVAAVTITSTNKTANQFDANGFTYTFDANDIFRVGGVPATLEEFRTALSRGDAFSASYSASAGAVSTFELTEATPVRPTTVTAEKDGTNRNDITVTVTSAVASVADTLVIQRAPVTGGTDEAANGTEGTYATIATVTPTASQIASGVVTYVDNDVPVGTYRYRAALVVDGQTGVFRADVNNESSETPAPDTTAPLAIDTVSTTNAGLPGDLGAGDVFKIVFNENIGTPSASATLRLDDNDTTVADLINGSNATFSVSSAAETVNGVSRAAGRVLTVTVTGAPAVVVAGSPTGVQLPAVITAIGGIADVAGNLLVTGGSQDLIIDQVGADTLNTSNDTTPATATITNPGVGGTSATVQFDEAVTGLVAADFTITNAADADGNPATNPEVTAVTAVDADTYTITIGGGEALAASDTVRLTSGSVLDAGNGNASPSANVDRVVS